MVAIIKTIKMVELTFLAIDSTTTINVVIIISIVVIGFTIILSFL